MVESCQRKVVFFKDHDCVEPVRDWLNDLAKKNKIEHSKILTRINRAGMGSFGDHRFLDGNLGELKIDYGPGYRIYFGLDGHKVIILLHGGTKKTQRGDIELARIRWKEYRG